MKYLLILLIVVMASCKNNSEEKNIEAQGVITTPMDEPTNDASSEDQGFVINPIEHASMVLDWNGTNIYVDSVGGAEKYASYTKADLILITDIHGDHLDMPTLQGLVNDSVQIVVPKAVFDMLPKEIASKAIVLNNGDNKNVQNVAIEAIPMYNLRPEALKFHTKGRGNGYVLEKDGQRVYISGDTEDIPEMRALKNIDIAFVCMNLPYTMTVDKAAEAVLAFKPKTVYPYHYRGTEGMSDVAKFKQLVNDKNNDIKVTQLDWYPKQ